MGRFGQHNQGKGSAAKYRKQTVNLLFSGS